MTIEELQKRIEDKQQKIAKMERNLPKYFVSEEFTKICDRFFTTGDRTELNEYKKSHDLWCLPEYYSKRYDLEDAKATLKKYQDQLEKERVKTEALANLPKVVTSFRDDLIACWDMFDKAKREDIISMYNRDMDYRTNVYEIREKYGSSWRDFLYISDEKIHESNVKDANKLIIDFLNRVSGITGTITDYKGLHLSRSNEGYTIINGLVIGEKGKAKVESIGAGGYNIQRYHIRVLVKDVK